MSIFLALLIALLSLRDPVGSSLVHNKIVIERPVANSDGGHAVAYRATKQIVFDSGYYAKLYANPEWSRIWASCTLVHEAAHLEYDTAAEAQPLLFQYVCLDRNGAPGWMKDHIYGLLKEEVKP